MRLKDLREKKFHLDGEGASDSVYLSECTDGDEVAAVRLDKVKSGHPVGLGQELCQLQPDGSGHFRISDTLAPDTDAGGPALVNSTAYRSGWDRTFGHKIAN